MSSPLVVSPSARPALVVGQGGIPIAPSEIVERVKRIHPALNLRFADGIGGVGWSITWEWPETDRRWQWVKDGRTDPAMAYDIIGYLPLDCSLDQAPGYLERSLRDYPREEVSGLVNRMSHWNTVEKPKEQVQALVAATMDDIAREQRAPQGQIVSVPSGPVKSKRGKAK